MDLKLITAILLGKVISKLNTIKGTGGTAAPGLYALKIDQNLVNKIHNKNNLQSVVVSGTNGKTTTARLISSLIAGKQKIIHNRQGSNLLRGVASTLIENSDIFGNIDADIALWEADEAALENIANQTNIKILILLNLFRDQLDRYGEINTIRKNWIGVVKNLPKNTILLLNSDDPSTNYLKDFAKCQTQMFGLETSNFNLPSIENVADVKYCIKCGNKLEYTKLYSAHLGKFKCNFCSFKRISPQISVTKAIFNSDFSSSIDINIKGKTTKLTYPLPGLFNTYNVTAAVAAAIELEINPKQIQKILKNFSAAFGRFQQVVVNGKNIIIFLIKNPAGANEVIRTIAVGDKLNLLLILNDNIADGRDVSWIWDTNWEPLAKKTKNLTISGSRSYDLANRLKYAGFKIAKYQLSPNTTQSIQDSLSKLPQGENLLILPTYTALLEVERSLQEMGVEKWQNQ